MSLYPDWLSLFSEIWKLDIILARFRSDLFGQDGSVDGIVLDLWGSRIDIFSRVSMECPFLGSFSLRLPSC